MLGKLLIAHPLLNDGFFNRSVVYISQYADEGIIGFVLNFRTQFKLRDVRPQVMNGQLPIYEGGPVAKNQLFFLHTLGEKIPDALQIEGDLYMGGDFNELLHLIDHENVSENDVRFFVGYSGWEKEQLDDEIAKGSWYINETDSNSILKIGTNLLWGHELEKQKKEFKIFSEIGFDPSLN
jgi:putative transcriptional regulator